MNLNDRLYTELFLQKKVNLYQDSYNKYFAEIWKDASLFKKFLTCGSEDVQKETALLICDRLLYDIIFPIPSFAFRLLMSSEYKEIEYNHNNNYQGQLHSVHSVMLYILGVWVFFNHQPFNGYLIDHFKYKQAKNQYEPAESVAIKSFILSWKLFSICHDIGYVFESSINENGFLKNKKFDKLFKEYNDIDFLSYYDLTMRSLSKLLFVQKIIDNSNETLESFFNKISINEPNVDEIRNSVKESNIYLKLHNVNDYNQLRVFLPYININDILVIVRNKEFEVVSIVSGDNNIVFQNERYSKKLESLKSCSNENSDFPCDEYIFDFYVKDTKTITYKYYQKMDIEPYYEYFKQASDVINKKFNFEYLTRKTYYDDENIQFEVYKFLKNELSAQKYKKVLCQKSIAFETNNIQLSKESLIVKIKEVLTSYEYKETDKNLTRDMYEYLVKEIKEEVFYKDVVKNIMDNKIERIFPLLNTFILYFAKEYPKKSRKYISVSGKNSKKINYDLFNNQDVYSKPYSRYRIDEFEKIMKFLMTETEKLGLTDIQTVLKYHPKHCYYDHGVISSSFLSQSYLTYKELIKNHNKSLDFLFPLTIGLKINDTTNLSKFDECYYEAISAILLHNIYPSRYKELFNKSFKQSLLNNPFSYFAAFCDVLQRWDRPKTIKYSETSYLGDYITGNNYDLKIVDNYICIDSISSQIDQSIYSSKYSLDEFLENGSDFIKLNISDNMLE